MGSQAPLRILSLDGGGIRGVSSLLILEDIMEKIRLERGLEAVPRPCECFDLIRGTSTGGIIAIMLGRLGMTVNECIQAYRDVAQQAFTRKKHKTFSSTGAFSATALERAIQKTVRKFCTESDCVERRSQGSETTDTCCHAQRLEFRDSKCTKTAVLAITKVNVDTPPKILTTYHTSAMFNGCTIWQVARATSAATTFFKPIALGRDGVEFIDAALGYNNPCELLIAEGERLFPDRKEHMQVLSIGTGLGEVMKISDSWPSIVKALKKMATSSKQVAARLEARYDERNYSRFNVEKGLEDITLSDWKENSMISAHTSNYLQENRKRVESFAKILATDDPTKGKISDRPSAASELSNSCDLVPKYYIPLSRNHRFVGRESQLETIQRKLFSEDECPRLAIVGLGGVGKTQVALQIAYWLKTHKPRYSIFWAPALSDDTFGQAYRDIAQKISIKEAGTGEDVRRLVQGHLSEVDWPWILIVDNADDVELFFDPSHGGVRINDYIPTTSDNHLVLLTTRSREVAVSAGFDIIDLDSMDSTEATSLLTKHLGSDIVPGSELTEILEELAYLPLAITQAAAYIKIHKISLAKYLSLLRSTEQDLVSLLSREFHDQTRYTGSQNAVASTWLVSFEQIRKSNPKAAELLLFLSCIEPKGIPQSILPELELEEMTRAIGILCSYAFLTRRGDTDVFDMHSLVHLAAQIWSKRVGRDVDAITNAIRHLSNIFPWEEWENRHLWREYFPHVFRLRQHSTSKQYDSVDRFRLLMKMGRCLGNDGRIKESVQCLEEAHRFAMMHCLDADPPRLTCQHELATAYILNGQLKEAITLLEQVVTIQAEELAETHPDRLASQHQLASAYISNGQLKEAIVLLEKVVTIRTKVLAEIHPDRLASQHELASAYRSNGQIKEAITLLEQVITIRTKVLAEIHPDRLTSQHELASAYISNGQIKEAITLLEKVVTIDAKVLAETHPHRLASQHQLASAYRSNGQIKEAITLLEQVVTIQTKVLAEIHPDRLASQHELASAYISNGQTKEAVTLLEQVVIIKAKVLAETHPARLVSQQLLAAAYYDDGQTERAINLMDMVIPIRRTILPENHPERLIDERWVAKISRETGRVL